MYMCIRALNPHRKILTYPNSIHFGFTRFSFTGTWGQSILGMSALTLELRTQYLELLSEELYIVSDPR